jgi:hypothetical protein
MRNIHVTASTTRVGIYCLYNCALKIEKAKPKPLVLTKFLRGRLLGLLALDEVISYKTQILVI